MGRVIVTNELVRQGQSERGGWNREQLRILGVKWPPKKGWRSRVLGRRISEEDRDRFLAIRGQLKVKPPRPPDRLARKDRNRANREILAREKELRKAAAERQAVRNAQARESLDEYRRKAKEDPLARTLFGK